MRIKDQAIVLHNIKYGDKSHIVKLFCKDHGILNCAARISPSPSSKIKPSVLMPLNIVDVEVDLKQNKEIQQITEVNCSYVYTNLHTDFIKLSISQFIIEVLNKTLKEQTGNLELFNFIRNSFIYLNESEEEYVSFHHFFLIELSKYLGFEPHANYSVNNPFFDCREGKFTPISLAFPTGLNKEQSETLYFALTHDLTEYKINNTQRQILLESLLAYYRFHVPGFNELKSTEILRQLN